MKTIIHLLAVLFIFAFTDSVEAKEPWWNAKWKYRYELSQSLGKAGDVAWARFNIPKECSANGGEDVRVVDEAGEVLRREVVFFESALHGVVAFELSGAGKRCWLYLGNSNAKSGNDWTAKAGVFLETRRIPKGRAAANNLKQIQAMFAESPWTYGGEYRDMIFDGFNPLGEPDRYVSHYRAYINVKKPGRYRYITVSDDASFLLINGKKVAQWPGKHRAGGGLFGNHGGNVKMAAGVARLDYYQCDFGEEQVAEAAVQPPGAKEPRLLNRGDYVSIYPAHPVRLEINGETLVADFSARQTEWVDLDGTTLALYTFSDASWCENAVIADRKWEFSDGWKDQGAQITKMFFGKGDYTVRLTVGDDTGREAVAERSFRVHAIDKAEVAEEGFLLQAFANFATSMPLESLTPEAAVSASRLFVKQERYGEAKRVYDGVRQHLGPQFWASGLAIDYMDLLAGPLKDPEAAVEAGREALGAVQDSQSHAAEVACRVGRAELDGLGKPEDALGDFKAAELRLAKADGASDGVRREILVGKGDAHRALGQVKEAYAAYREAESIPLPGAVDRPYNISSYGLTVENFLLRREYDEAREILDRWEAERPVERLAGYSSILRSRLDLATNNYNGAVRELEYYLAGEPAGLYAQEAMFDLADLYLRGGEVESARKVYERILDRYQDPAIQKKAKEGLGKSGFSEQ